MRPVLKASVNNIGQLSLYRLVLVDIFPRSDSYISNCTRYTGNQQSMPRTRLQPLSAHGLRCAHLSWESKQVAYNYWQTEPKHSFLILLIRGHPFMMSSRSGRGSVSGGRICMNWGYVDVHRKNRALWCHSVLFTCKEIGFLYQNFVERKNFSSK